LTAAIDYRHCPNCLAEYRAGPMICVDCGTLLVDGPSPMQARERGEVEVVERSEDPASGTPDRFALEEAPLVLTSMVEEDVDAFLSMLEQEEIGARRGEPAGDLGVEIVVHAANLIDAQAVLVEFTGDVRLVDEIAVDDEPDDGDMRDLAVVTWTRIQDVGAQANRLRERGVAVRIELPDGSERDSVTARATILVPVDELDRARQILGIAF
jgi:hypothetical protein